jgi:ABC-2 type transport system permease protein
MGASLDLRKLLVYPVPHARLFYLEVLLRFFSGGEMLLVLAGGAAGVWLHPASRGGAAMLRIALATLLFALLNVLLGSGLRSVVERLLSRGRVREVVVLLLLTLMMLPRFLVLTGTRVQWLRNFATPREDGLPWTLAAHALLGHHAWLALLGLLAWTALAALFGRWQFERSLRYDAIAAQATVAPPEASRSEVWIERFYRFPGWLWRDPLAVLVEKELRTLSRSPRFRMVFVMGFSFGMLVWLPLILGRRASPDSVLSQNFLVIVTVYALTLLGQVSYWNAFGFDRSAVQIYYAAPQPIARVIVAKNLASLTFIYLEAAILTAVTLAFRIRLGFSRIAETAVVLTVSAVYMLALGNISSVQYPRALTPERVSQGGASSRFQALIFLFYPLALLPVFLAYAARYLLSSDLAFWVLITAAALIGAALYWIAMDSAIQTALHRREHILQELGRGEGPIVSQ